MTNEKFWDDYEIGATREGTFGRTLTETDIVLHAGQTGDFYPHHMDARWCAQQPFQHRIAHGTLVFSVGVGLSAGEINPHALSYGYDRLRFLAPVFIGDTLRARVTITEKRPHKRDSQGIVVEKLEVLKNEGELVLVCEHLLLVEKRPAKGDNPQ